MRKMKHFGITMLVVALLLQLFAITGLAASLTFSMQKAEAYATSQTIVLEGSISSGISQELTIRVLKGNNMLYLNQFTCEDDGSFQWTIPVEGIKKGETLQVFLGGSGVTEPKELSVVVTDTSSGGGSTGGGSIGGGTGGTTEEPETERDLAYIQGGSDGTFRPGDAITRAEVSMIFARLGTGQSVFTGSYDSSFTDVDDGSWYYDCVGYAQSAGIVKGYSDGTFQPNKQITRAEFATMVARYAKLENGQSSSFSDVKGHWAEGAVAALTEQGWVGGYSDGTFHPDMPVTRAEVTKIINRMLDRVPDQEALDAELSNLTTFSDVEKTHWAFYEILEAANG